MKTVYGIATILDEKENPRLFEVWTDLVSDCGLPVEMLSPVPHFTWHVAEGYEQPRVQEILGGISSKSKPFRVQASGLGLFTGESPVLYVPIRKKIRLIRFHRRLSKEIHPYALEPSNYYTPDNWIPHITIAQGVDLPHHLACAVEQLAYKEIKIEIMVNHLALGYQTVGDSWGILGMYRFGSQEEDGIEGGIS